MTYREIAINRLMSIGISEYDAKEIINLIEQEGEYAPQVFQDFKEHPNDNWDAEAEFV